MGWLIFGGIIGVIWFFSWLAGIIQENKNVYARVSGLEGKNDELTSKINQWEDYSTALENKENDLTKREALFKRLFKERTQNFPVVGEIWSQLIKITEEEREKALRYKSRPAVRAADEIKSIKQEKRVLVKELSSWKYRALNYEAVYPWLAEELQQDIDDQVESELYYSVYSEEERADAVSLYMTPDDYRKLSVSERNQLALDRYWQRRKKSNWMIGKMYERYVGYLYEKDGWNVEYFGIHKRFEDLGRDLIATKGKQVHVIQCKNWSRFKTIYENHIFQLFGTTYSLQKSNPKHQVTPVFYCTTSFSETAHEFAKRLGIILKQNHKLERYPSIKCNISAKGEKIYHLPFDQQYDNTKLVKPGERYADTIAEAEASGFRRAFHWSGAGNK